MQQILRKFKSVTHYFRLKEKNLLDRLIFLFRNDALIESQVCISGVFSFKQKNQKTTDSSTYRKRVTK